MSTAIRLSALVGALFLGACEAAPSQEAAAKPDPWADRDTQARNLLLAELRDPESAKFRNVQRIGLQGRPADQKEPVAYCGEVNAKNAFGGYTGFVQFAVFGKTAEVRDPQLPANVTYYIFCQRDGTPYTGEPVEFSTSGR